MITHPLPAKDSLSITGSQNLSAPVIVWWRNDLRLSDNTPIQAALTTQQPLIFVYIHYEHLVVFDHHKQTRARHWWLYHSLQAMEKRLLKVGGHILFYQGIPHQILSQLVNTTGATAIFYNKSFHPKLIAEDQKVTKTLKALGCATHSYSSTLIWDHSHIHTQKHQPYSVFTPFFRAALKQPTQELISQQSSHLVGRFFQKTIPCSSLTSLQLLPNKPNWSHHWSHLWQPGELNALKQLNRFLDRLHMYQDKRDIPGEQGTSQLSAYLALGEISPQRILTTIKQSGLAHSHAGQSFVRQLVWREFSFYLLDHQPNLVIQPLKPSFTQMAWHLGKPATLEAWQQGNTGYPLVDAGMRELYTTGWMHNRVRMVVASFLTKNLMIHWRYGASWFMDTLVDACWANNFVSWQWVAGCGADAAPYYRIFNPIIQGKKFDPNGDYIRKWLPELKHSHRKVIHDPWQQMTQSGTQKSILTSEHQDYPRPIVNLQRSRNQALEAYEIMKRENQNMGASQK
ncbi:MAG: deoxyribodipyrimidine photo-lyase [Proteobacteria bacterium]|nr:deoxyribodipyrimidine photo-lyase [Pseudomonadota bacterium]